eukprot:15459024-Alexandrium_andersonii.AAC.1
MRQMRFLEVCGSGSAPERSTRHGRKLQKAAGSHVLQPSALLREGCCTNSRGPTGVGLRTLSPRP